MKLESISLFLTFFAFIVTLLGSIKIHAYPGKSATAPAAR